MTVDEKSIAAPSAVRTQDDRCPACTETTTSVAAEKESWIRCDFCKKWFHWRCVGEGGELAAIDKWYCGPCREENPKRVVTLKPPARKSSRKKPIRDYANLHVDAAAAAAGTNFADAQTWATTLASKAMVPDTFRRMAGAELSQEWLDTDLEAMRDPVVILDPEGLGMEMPSSDITVGRIATMLGADVPLEVIDVATQSGLAGWTLGRWAEYYESSERDKIRNVISLEISGTELGGMVLPPRLVREIDWVEKYWPSNRKGKGHVYPKVQLYCLMGVEGAWTDWHVDFAGSSVYYHILKGAKTFLFVRPTPANLAAYQRWSGSEMQSSTWLGDLVDEVIKVDLTAGNTMIIPTGWIHAVHTPVDALVFGGNFLNSYNAALQLKIRDIEIATRVPKKFRFPLFTKLSWYVGEKALRDLRAKEEFATRILESLEAVARFLVSQVHDMERGTEAARREAKDQVPGDRVKDPAAVARELRWRVRLALHIDSDSEEGGGSSGAVTRSSSKSVEAQPPPPASTSARGVKRSRSAEENGLEDGAAAAEDVPFRNFRPKTWRCVRRTSEQSTDRRVRARPPPHNGDGAEDEDEGWIGQWEPEAVVKSEEGSKETEVEMETEEQDTADAATVISKHVVTTRVRRTTTGIERHRVESVLEKWEWPDTKG